MVWRIPHGVKVKNYGSNNVFTFYFANVIKRHRVWSGEPWQFDKHLISLVKPKGLGMLSKMDFSKFAFSIHIHNVPIVCLNEDYANFW